jgi:putative ABC transport system substrate-binding protein
VRRRRWARRSRSRPPRWRPAGALCVLVIAIVTLARAADAIAQPEGRVPRIGNLSIGGDPGRASPLWGAFLEELKALGYTEGRNVLIERRLAGGDHQRLPGLVRDLARLGLDVVVTTGPTETLAVRRALPTTPIVMVVVPDPVAAGLVASLARPGGSVTGLSAVSQDLRGKGLQLFKEAVPRLTHVALLLNPGNPVRDATLRGATRDARSLGLRLQAFDARKSEDLEGAFTRMVHEGVGGVVVPIDGTFFSQRARIAELAARQRLPAMYDWREFVEAGGLMSYGPVISDLFRRAAVYVDRILKGAKPADLPVQEPTKFELVVNLRAARGLGLTIPPTILLRADRVLE